MSEDRDNSAPERGGLSSWLLGGGTEPDPRFSLANERTFLAWIRTSLALLAGGIGLEAFAREVFPSHWRQVLAIGLIVLSMVMSATAAARWVRIERAMRRSLPLPLSISAVWLAIGTTIVAAVAGVIFLVNGS